MILGTQYSGPVTGCLAAMLLCSTAALGQTASTRQSANNVPTFAKDIAPILQRSCQACHRPGGMGPMSLVRYEETRPWARSIANKVQNGEMPPWFVEKTLGIQQFKDDISVSAEEIATMTRWVEVGAPRGTDADMPPALDFTNAGEWDRELGPPNLVITSPEFTVAPSGPDRWINVQTGVDLPEDRYIRALELKPEQGSFPVVHHAAAREAQSEDEHSAGSLIIYNIGKRADILPEGTGRLLRAGSDINFNIHLHANGEEVTGRVKLALWFYPKGQKPAYAYRVTPFGSGNNGGYDVEVPPNTPDVRLDEFHVFNTPVKLINFNPHMHSRGKRQCLEVIYPDSRREVLNCAGFSYQWLSVYTWADDVAPLLPSGTVLHIINWFDNSAGNKNNPDPRQWVGFGNRTVDEMSYSTIAWIPLTEAAYDEERERRGAAKSTDLPSTAARR